MQLKFTQVLETMRGAQRFCDINSAALGGLNSGGGRAAFDGVVARLSALADAQEAHRIQASGELAMQRRLARQIRRYHMWPVVRVARSKVPAAAQLAAVQMPPSRSNPLDTAQRARGMAAAVAPYRDLLVEGGLASGFVEQLVTAAGELEAAAGGKQDHVTSRVGATGNILTEVAEARIQVGALDALVDVALRDNPTLHSDWRKVVRDIRRALRPVGSGTSAAPAGAPAPAPEPAGALKLAA